MPDDRVIAAKPLRQPQDNVPQSKQAREKLLEAIRAYVERERPVPPLSMEELRTHTDAVLDEAGMDRKYADFAAVLVNNEAWRETVAAIPYEKRLLLLPKCLRNAKECPAKFDEIGLLCEHCGRCVIDDLKSQAERLGYAVLVAEGSPVVMSLIEAGRIEGVVGASCLSVLEKVFPYMEAGAVPGIAIPLLQDGCANTSVDLDWLWEAIYQTADDQTRRFDLDALHQRVDDWFSREAPLPPRLRRRPSPDASRWPWTGWPRRASAGGPSWRPARTRPFRRRCAGARGGPAQGRDCRRVLSQGVADPRRYRRRRRRAVRREDAARASTECPIALNVGDLLLGEGYRLLAEVDVPDAPEGEAPYVPRPGTSQPVPGAGQRAGLDAGAAAAAGPRKCSTSSG